MMARKGAYTGGHRRLSSVHETSRVGLACAVLILVSAKATTVENTLSWAKEGILDDDGRK